MRIEAYNQVQQLYQPKQLSKAQQTGGTARKDLLQISSAGKDYQSTKAAVSGAADVREELTASIKARIESGNYSVDPAAFADKLLKKFDEMR